MNASNHRTCQSSFWPSDKSFHPLKSELILLSCCIQLPVAILDAEASGDGLQSVMRFIVHCHLECWKVTFIQAWPLCTKTSLQTPWIFTQYYTLYMQKTIVFFTQFLSFFFTVRCKVVSQNQFLLEKTKLLVVGVTGNCFYLPSPDSHNSHKLFVWPLALFRLMLVVYFKLISVFLGLYSKFLNILLGFSNKLLHFLQVVVRFEVFHSLQNHFSGSTSNLLLKWHDYQIPELPFNGQLHAYLN